MKASANLSFWRPTAAVIRILTIPAMMTTPAAFAQVSYSVTDLGTLPGYPSSVARGINSNGQVVGSATTNGIAHAFLYSAGIMTDLNSLVPTHSGWTQTDANAINDNGQVVGARPAAEATPSSTAGGP
jgi:probable HAF family extracellular repeat protein